MNIVIQKSGGREYVYLRESFWDPVRKKNSSRNVKSCGRLDLLLAKDPEIIEKLKAQAAAEGGSEKSRRAAGDEAGIPGQGAGRGRAAGPCRSGED